MNMRITSAKLLAILPASMLMLSGCDPAPKPDTAPAPQARPADQAPPEATPDVTPSPANPGDTPPGETPAAPAQPPPEAPPPTEPSPTAKPTSLATEPPLDRMQSARAPAKLGVPVDLKYSFDTAPVADKPVMLHLAAVPRVAGTHLALSIKEVEGLRVASAGNLNVQKASAHDAYRQQMSLTRAADVPELRVLITMELPEGLAHGFYSIPLDPGTKSQKQESVKQR